MIENILFIYFSEDKHESWQWTFETLGQGSLEQHRDDLCYSLDRLKPKAGVKKMEK